MKLNCGIARVAAAVLCAASWSAASRAADTLEQARPRVRLPVRPARALRGRRARRHRRRRGGVDEPAARGFPDRAAQEDGAARRRRLDRGSRRRLQQHDERQDRSSRWSRIRPISPRSTASRSSTSRSSTRRSRSAGSASCSTTQRFVGNVGWRQNEQTFDALRAQLGSGKLKADLTYADQVNRVFGPDSPVGRWHGDVVLANVAQTLPVGTLTFFDYFLDLDDAVAQSSNTLGARLTGSKKLGSIGGTYILSYAHQADAGREPRELHGRLLPARRRAQLREDRRRSRLRGARQQRHRPRSRRRSRRCTSSRAGPTSSSRRRPPASRTAI